MFLHILENFGLCIEAGFSQIQSHVRELNKLLQALSRQNGMFHDCYKCMYILLQYCTDDKRGGKKGGRGRGGRGWRGATNTTFLNNFLKYLIIIVIHMLISARGG